MKKYLILVVLLGLFTCLILSSCGEDVPGSELDPTTVVIDGGTENGDGSSSVAALVDQIDYQRESQESEVDSTMKALETLLGSLQTTQFYIHGGKDGEPGQEHRYQLQFNLCSDNYCGYLLAPQNFQGRLKSIYDNTNNEFNDGPNDSFLHVKNTIIPLLQRVELNNLPEIKAIALLMYNYSAQELADVYGPFPYKDYKKNKQSSPFTYNSVEDIYTSIIADIDLIVATLSAFDARPEWYKAKVQAILNQHDKIGRQSIAIWLKFANSLKLRMAMHTVKVAPDKAKQWAEEAVVSGVLSSSDEQILLNLRNLSTTHPLFKIAKNWKDTRLNASFQSIMKSLKHPLFEEMFDANNGDIPLEVAEGESEVYYASTDIVGLRAGIRTKPRDGGGNITVFYSLPSGYLAYEALHFMKYSEVLFLKAEGALRGWNMGAGSAQSFYEDGVRAAYAGSDLNQSYLGVVDDYLNVQTADDYKYIDPNNSKNNIKSITKIGVAWSASDENEVKLEKIITQKYIANYPYSFEAWTDIRRTGYPKIFPVLHDDGDGSIKEGDIIRRMVFPSRGEAAVAADAQSSGVSALNGPDLQGTRLWWDIDKSNF